MIILHIPHGTSCDTSSITDISPTLRIKSENKKGWKQNGSLSTHIASFLQVHFVPLLHGPHVIILLLQSSYQLIQLQGLDARQKLWGLTSVILWCCVLMQRCRRGYISGVILPKLVMWLKLTGLRVVRLKVLQQLFLLHDFVLSLVQLDPEETMLLLYLPLLENTHPSFTSLYIHTRTDT